MSRTPTWTSLRRMDLAREQRPIARFLLGAMALAALYLAGHGLLPQHAPKRTTLSSPVGQTIAYRAVPALLAQTRAHDPLLRLPHARWYLRVRHGGAQLVVVDHTSRGRDDGTLVAAVQEGR